MALGLVVAGMRPDARPATRPGTRSDARPGTLGLFLCLLLLAPALLFAEDRVELVNGTVYTGSIIAMDEQTVTILSGGRERIIDRSVVAAGSFGAGAVDAGGEEGPTAAAGADIASSLGSQLADTRPDLVVRLSELLSGSQVPDELLLWLPFEGEVRDRSRYRREIANNGAGFGQDETAGGYLTSSGTGQYLEVAEAADLNALDAFTLSMYLYPQTRFKTQYLFSKWTRTTGETAEGTVAVHLHNGTITAYFVGEDGAYHSASSPAAFQLGAWQHFALSFAEGQVRMYRNGQEVHQSQIEATRLRDDASPVQLFSAPPGGSADMSRLNYVGRVDDLRLYEGALAADEIAELALTRSAAE